MSNVRTHSLRSGAERSRNHFLSRFPHRLFRANQQGSVRELTHFELSLAQIIQSHPGLSMFSFRYFSDAVFRQKQYPCALSQMDQGEVRMMPEIPTTTNCEPDQATPIRTSKVLECWAVQVRPSGEVRMVPLVPMTTNFEPDQATP